MPQTGGACQQAQAPGHTQQLGQRRQVIGSRHTKQVVLQRGHAGGRKAQHKAIEREVVKAAARQGVGIVLVVAAVAMPAAQVGQLQHVLRGLGGGRQVQWRTAGGGRDVAPEAPHAQRQGQHHQHEHRRKQRHQQVVREDVVKVAHWRHQCRHPPVAHCAQHQETGQRGGQCQRQRQPVALVQAAQCRWPRVVGVGLPTHLRHGLGYVDGKFMWRRVLAGMQAGTAVVAQVGHEMHVGLGKRQAARHGREHGTKAFAVAAGVADLHLAGHFGLRRCKGHGFTPCQGPGIACQGFKRLHGQLLG